MMVSRAKAHNDRFNTVIYSVIMFVLVVLGSVTTTAQAQPVTPPPVVYVATGSNSYDNLFGGGNYVTWQTDSISSPGFDYDNPDGQRAVRTQCTFTGSTLSSNMNITVSRTSCCCTWMGVFSNNSFEVWVRGLPGVRYNLSISHQGVVSRSITPDTQLPESPQPSLSWQFNGANPGPISTSTYEQALVANGPTREFPQYPGVTYTRVRVVPANGGGTMVQGFCSCCGCCAGGNYSTSGVINATTEIECELVCEPRWLPFGSGASSTVNAVAILPNGNLVAGGVFTSVGPGVAANRVALWNGTEWSPLGTGMNSTVRALLAAPTGVVVAGGSFVTAGGTAASRIAYWDGTSWLSLGSGLNGTVNALALLPGNYLVAAGNFSTAGGTPVGNIALWDGIGTWYPLGSGLDNTVNALAVLPNGHLLVAGDFTTAGGVPAERIARWDGTAWSAVGDGFNNAINALAVLPNGNIVAGGTFTIAGGMPVNRIAQWDGTSWSPLGSGLNNRVNAVAALPNGDVVVGGTFTTAGDIAATRVARWNGLSWLPMGQSLQVAVALGVEAVMALPGGELIVGGRFDNSGPLSVRNIAHWKFPPNCIGRALAIQDTQTNFTDNTLGDLALANGSELDALYASICQDVLRLAIAGNLKSDYTHLDLFIDSIPGGQNQITNPNPSGNFNALRSFAGTRFDSSFAADYFFTFNGGASPYRFFADYSRLRVGSDPGLSVYLGETTANSSGYLVGGQSNNLGIRATINNINIAGVTAGTGLSSGAGVTTGVEVAIPLHAIGNPGGPIRVAAMLTNPGRTVVSNQFLGGVAGAPIAAAPSVLNLSNVPGQQHVIVEPSLQLTSTPQDASTCLGGQASFSVQASSTHPLAYIWRKNGSPLSIQANPTAATSTLQLPLVLAQDLGTYDCIIYSNCDSTISNPATLTRCAADFNCDGGIDGFDIDSFFIAWESGDISSDVNDDGGIDGSDVELFIALWEAGGC